MVLTNFDPNNYQEFYQEALKNWENIARQIAAQTTQLAKWSAMEQTRDQWFALWQASKYWDTQNYRWKIMWDIEQKSELDRTKMLAEQFGKEQANTANQQNILTGLGSALLQMKLAKEAATKWGGWGGWSSYGWSQITPETLAKLWIWWDTTTAETKAPTKKEESWFWKVMNYLPWALLAAAPFVWWTIVWLPIAWVMTALWVAWTVADAAEEVKRWNMGEWVTSVVWSVWAKYAWKKIWTSLAKKAWATKVFPALLKLAK